MVDAPRSDCLFLIGCSNSKAPGGANFPRKPACFTELIDSNLRGRIYKTRSRLLEVITEGHVDRAKRALRDLPYNAEIRRGPDFGARERSGGAYLQARIRYTGRLFQRVPEAAWVERQHRVLIFSGLYGLLLPDDPIQRYSLHLADHPLILAAWRGQDLATDLLLDFAKREGVRHVFSLLGEDLYRSVFEWNRLEKAGLSVVHAFGEQNAGPGVLPAAGAWLSWALSSGAGQLLELFPSGYATTDFERLAFCPEPVPPHGWPDESGLLAEQIRKYYQPLVEETNAHLGRHFGAARWNRLRGIRDACEFLVSGVSIWRFSRELAGDLSPVCVQLGKAVETILNELTVDSAVRALAGFPDLGDGNFDKFWKAARKGHSVSLTLFARVLGDAAVHTGPRGVAAGLARTPLGNPTVQGLREDIEQLAKMRNPSAHTGLVTAALADDCVRLVVGDLGRDRRGDGSEVGLVSRILDAVDTTRKAGPR